MSPLTVHLDGLRRGAAAGRSAAAGIGGRDGHRRRLRRRIGRGARRRRGAV